MPMMERQTIYRTEAQYDELDHYGLSEALVSLCDRTEAQEPGLAAWNGTIGADEVVGESTYLRWSPPCRICGGSECGDYGHVIRASN